MLRAVLFTALLLAASFDAGVSVEAAEVRPSFDCAKAASPLEKSVCTDAGAAQQDRLMAAAFGEALTEFPEPLRPRLRDSQRTFLRYADIFCRRVRGFAPGCLAAVYEARVDELKRSSFADAGGRRYVRLYHHDAVAFAPGRAAPGADEYEQPEQLTELVQIARPVGPGEAAWNAAVAARLLALKQPLAREGDGLNRYTVDLLATAPGFIEAQVSWKGPPRWGIERQIHWSLRAARPIEATDLFENPARAFDTIARLSIRGLQREADSTPIKDPALRTPIPSLADARKAVADLQNWTFSPGDLWVDLGSDPPVFVTARVPWSGIKPLLRKDASLNPATLAGIPETDLR